jgi:hypothetical protein
MIMETQDQQIRYLENYYESRCRKLSDEGRECDALSLYQEMVIDGQDPDEYLFLTYFSEI